MSDRIVPNFEPDDLYVTRGLAAILGEGAHYFMLCFSDRVPDDQSGPHRFTRDEITSWFADGWALDLEPATIEVTIDPAGRPAWLVDARRT